MHNMPSSNLTYFKRKGLNFEAQKDERRIDVGVTNPYIVFEQPMGF